MKKQLSDYLDVLHKASDEESVMNTLVKIIKNFNVSSYREIIMSNPYFKSLIIDIKGGIIIEMDSMIEMIKVEIENLNGELLLCNRTEDFIKFKELKRECVFLLTELENRKTDLYLLN